MEVIVKFVVIYCFFYLKRKWGMATKSETLFCGRLAKSFGIYYRVDRKGKCVRSNFYFLIYTTEPTETLGATGISAYKLLL